MTQQMAKHASNASPERILFPAGFATYSGPSQQLYLRRAYLTRIGFENRSQRLHIMQLIAGNFLCGLSIVNRGSRVSMHRGEVQDCLLLR
jgi:hypothetical protein